MSSERSGKGYGERTPRGRAVRAASRRDAHMLAAEYTCLGAQWPVLYLPRADSIQPCRMAQRICGSARAERLIEAQAGGLRRKAQRMRSGTPPALRGRK